MLANFDKAFAYNKKKTGEHIKIELIHDVFITLFNLVLKIDLRN